MKYRVVLCTLLVLGIALGIWSPATSVEAQAATGRLRLVHAVPDAPAVDLYVNGTLVATDVEYGNATQHFTVLAGATDVEVRLAGDDATSPAVFSQSFEVLQDLAFSLILQGSQSNLQSLLSEDILDPLPLGSARLAAVHVASGADAVDIVRTDGTPFAPLMVGLAYNAPYGTINLPAGTYPLAAVSAGLAAAAEGDILADAGRVDLRTNVSYTLVVTASDVLVLSAPVNAESGESLTRLVHGVADAPAVDVYINEVLAIPNLAFGAATYHLGLPVGDHAIALREAGTPPNAEPIFSDTLTISDAAQTVAIVANADGELALQYTDDATDVAPDMARVQVLNLTGDSVDLSIDEALSEDAALDLAPGDYALSGDAEMDVRLYGGTLYTVLVYGDGEVALLDTPLDVQLASVPFDVSSTVAVIGSDTEVAAADTTTETTTEVSEPAAPATETTPETTTETAAPTEVAPATEVASADPASGTTTQSNADSNPLFANSGSETTTTTETTTDPANVVAEPLTPEQQAALQQPAAVQPEQPLQQPPAQEIPAVTPTPVQPPQVAPAQAQVNPNARPTKPGVYPPVEIVFGVVNLNQGVNLQCREYPSAEARSLGLIPNGTELIIVGLPAPRDTTGEIGRTDAITIDGILDFTPLLEDDISMDNVNVEQLAGIDLNTFWLSVDWILEDGTAFGCWVSARYVEINFDNQRIDEVVEYLTLVDNKNFDLVPYNVPGGPRDPDVVVSPQQVSQPTPRPNADFIVATVNVNQGVNLQFRRTPGTDGESLALIPGGSQLAVLAKITLPVTGAPGEPTIPEWLYAVFVTPEGTQVSGWISAEYVLLTRAGRLISLDDIPTIPPGSAIPGGGFIDPNTGEIMPEQSGVTGGGQAQAQPQQSQQPQILGRLLADPGANVNLRDLPSTDALTRVSMPWDARLQVIGRNGAGDWLNVAYNSDGTDVEGWVAASLVEVTFQGQPYDIGQLTITNGEADTFGQ